jgi:hypothetical protein
MPTMEITDAAFERLKILLGDSDLSSNGIAIIMGKPMADLVRTDEGKAEWKFFGTSGWQITPIPILKHSPAKMLTYRGIKFFLSTKPVPTQLDFIDGQFVVNGEQAI